MKIEGVWLPIITPFRDGVVDYKSYESLIHYYLESGIHGLVPLGTTGESPTVEEDEFFRIVETTLRAVNNRVPVYFGVGGNYTEKVISRIRQMEQFEFDGILSVAPYYNRPSQEGIYSHFKAIAESTDRNIILYNIPYRTGRNMENSTIYKLSELKNIVGIKDSCGDIRRSMELLFNKPDDFSVVTGEDILFYPTLTMGGDGGILAAAHIDTGKYLDVFRLIKSNNCNEAQSVWKGLMAIIPLLFAEPNPCPLKYILKKKNLIASDETRLPLTKISEDLKRNLDTFS